MLKISILIANYNNGRYFKDCYDSLVAQDYPNWEAVVVDDCSTDDSVTVIRQLTEGDERVRLITRAINKGVGYTKRQAAEAATGAILTVLDPDDAIKSHTLQRVAEAFEQHKDAVAVYTGYINCDAQLQQVAPAAFAGNGINHPLEYWEKGIGTIHHFFAFKKEAYDQTEGIDATVRNADDIDLYLKIEETGNIYRINEHLHLYRNARGSLSSFENAYTSWVWVMRVFYSNGKRRIEQKLWPYSQYSRLIIERFLFCLGETKEGNDKKTFLTLRRDFFNEPFNRKLILSPVFLKYAVRHFKSFFW